MRKLLICPLFLFLTILAAGHGSVFKQYTTSDGLLSNMVYCAMQDSKGFLWFGTDCGVNRFDGKRFQQFTVENGLSDNEIFNIRQDSKGRIWFLTYNGRLSYFLDGIIYNEQNDTTLKNSFFGASFHEMYEDTKGNLWFMSLPKGCLKVTPDKKFTIYNEWSSIWAMYEDSSGNIHLVGDSVHSLETKTKQKSPFKIKDKTWSTSFGERGELLYMSGDRLMHFKNGKHHLLLQNKPHINNLNVTRITKSKTGRVWVNTNINGSYMLSPVDNYSKARNFLPHKIVMNNYEDNEKNTWFCTSGEGLYLLKARSEGVTYITRDNGLNDDKITAFLKLEKDVYLLGSGNGTISLIRNDTVYNHKLNATDIARRLIRITDLQHSKSKDIIYCASDIGVFRIKIKDTDLSFHPYSTYSINTNDCLYNYSAKSCMPDTGGNCHATLSFGVYKEKEIPGCLKQIALISRNDLRTFTHFFDKDNNLWSSDILGLKLNGKSIPLSWKGEKQLNRIVSIRQSGKAIIMAIEGSGILAYEHENKTHLLTTQDGLASSTARKIFTRGNYIYVATNQGISKLLYDGNRLRHVRNYTIYDGLVNNDVLDVYAEDDEIYAATASGLCILKEDAVERNSKPPSVYFSSVKNGEVNHTDYSNLCFLYDDLHLIITFIAPTFENPERLIYRYNISKDDDAHEGWTETVNNRIEFGALNPGVYTFLLSAKKINSDWSQPLKLRFSVTPPFWQTGWFTWLAAILISGLAAMIILRIYRRRLRRQLEALEKREAVNRERSRIATDIHDDLGSELTTIAINAEVLKHLMHADGKLLSHLDSLTASSRVVIEKMSEIIWAVNATNDSLKNLIAYVHEYAGKYFEKTQIKCHASLPSILPDYIITAAYRRNVFLIIKEAFHNVVRHSKATEVTIAISVIKNNVLEITIQDNGTGCIPAEVSLSRNGLMNMKKRAADIKGSLSIKGTEGKGCVVALSVPLPVQKKENFHTKV